jgi:hypothetical protein
VKKEVAKVGIGFRQTQRDSGRRKKGMERKYTAFGAHFFPYNEVFKPNSLFSTERWDNEIEMVCVGIIS